MELNETRQSIILVIRNDDNDYNNNDDDNNVININNNHYGKLVKQSLMNNFNINDFIESTVPGSGSGNSVGGDGNIGINNNGDDEFGDIQSTFIFLLFKCFVIGFIILAAIFGNMLVIVSVMQHRKLR